MWYNYKVQDKSNTLEHKKKPLNAALKFKLFGYQIEQWKKKDENWKTGEANQSHNANSFTEKSIYQNS